MGRIEDDDDLFIPGKTSGKRSRPSSDNDKKPRKRQKVNSGEAVDSPPGSPSSSKVHILLTSLDAVEIERDTFDT